MMLRSSVKAFVEDSLYVYSRIKVVIVSFGYDVSVWLHGYSTVQTDEPEDYIYSVACEAWLWVLFVMSVKT